MKIIKKILAITTSGLLATSLCVMSHASVTKYSDYGYLGSATYWASAEFNGRAYVPYSAGMHCTGGSLMGTTEQNGVTFVIVKSRLFTPGNYDVPISRRVE